MTKEEILLLKNEVAWTHDILKRIVDIGSSDQDDKDKLHAIAWFAKQGLKAIREE